MSTLRCRLATPADYPALESMIIDSFEPITWFKKLDERHGPLNGHDWRDRWRRRLAHVFSTQIILLGQVDGETVAAATATTDDVLLLGYIDLLAVDLRHQGKGYGRQMLRAMLDHLRSLGMQQCHLDCLTDNERGNALYAAEGWDLVSTSHRWFKRL